MSSCWAEAGGCLCPSYVVPLCWVKLLSVSYLCRPVGLKPVAGARVAATSASRSCTSCSCWTTRTSPPRTTSCSSCTADRRRPTRPSTLTSRSYTRSVSHRNDVRHNTHTRLVSTRAGRNGSNIDEVSRHHFVMLSGLIDPLKFLYSDFVTRTIISSFSFVFRNCILVRASLRFSQLPC